MERNQGQKWLGCMLAAHGSMMQHMDLADHMEQSMKTTHANPILQDITTSIYTRRKYFNACFQHWSVWEVVTVPCPRNNFMHLTSFLGNLFGQL